jgi:microcystin-dependent protein
VLTGAEMPTHSHNLMADPSTSSTGNDPSPATVLGQSSGKVTPTGQAFSANLYASGNPGVALNDGACAPTGNGQAHENYMPSLVLNFCICIGSPFIFPLRN